MRIANCILIGALLIAMPLGVLTAQDLELNGWVRNYMGMLTGAEGDFSIVQNALDLEMELGMEIAGFLVNPFIYQTPGEELDIGLREAYLDIFAGTVDLRIGKQQIIWGKAEGVFITDIISPKDLTEFLLPDFDEIRTGVTAMKTDVYLGYHTFEVVWIPVFASTIQPASDSLWAPAFPFSVPASIKPTEEVEPRIGNTELFAKYSYLGSFADFELMGGYFWDDDLTPHITDRTFSGPELTAIEITPRHHRLGLIGGSFSLAPAGLVLRGEGGYYTGKFFPTADPADADGVVERDFINYAAGIDLAPFGLIVSGQLIQRIILNYEDAILADQVDNLVTLLVADDFLRETLRAELFAYIGLNNLNALLRPKIVYDITDGFEIEAGANIFLGNEGQFGQFDENDMVFTKLTYSF